MELKIHKKYYKAIGFVFSTLLFGYTLYLLCVYPHFLSQLKNSFDLLLLHKQSVLLHFVIFLLFVNWGIEAYKWKILVVPITHITYYQAFRSVLIGLSAGFFTPRSVGDYFGRLFSVDSDQKWQLTGAVMVGRLGQMYATLSFGFVSLIYIYNKNLFAQWINLFSLTLVLSLGLVLLFIFRIKVLQGIKNTLPRIFDFLKIIQKYGKAMLLKIILWSILRHLVYTFQFIFILQLIDNHIQFWEILPYVSLVYLSKSIVPSFNFLSDLGVREFSSIFFLGLCGIMPQTALTAGMFIWFVNILFPSMLGGLLIWRK